MLERLRSNLRPALRALPLLALLPAAAFAESQMMLRIRQAEIAGSNDYQLLQVRTGDFQAQQALADPAEADLIIVGRDTLGRELFRRLTVSPRRFHAEVFDPVTGQIALSREIQRDSGVVEVHVPTNPALATIDIIESAASKTAGRGPQAAALPTVVGDQLRPALPAPARRFDRQTLDAMNASKGASAPKAQAAAAPIGTAWLWRGGETNASMDVLLMGDGYTAAEMGKWEADAKKVADGILADPLFAKYKTRLNILRVDLVSEQSGVSTSSVKKNTALGMNFGCYGVDRLLCVDDALVYAAADAVTPPDGRDVIITAANSTTYGGAGRIGKGNIGTMSMHPSAIEIALHEIGHSAFNLADEYDYGGCFTFLEPQEANVSAAKTRAAARKWGWMIGKATTVPTKSGTYPNGTVGLFEGGKYCPTGVYRPTENSRMRTLGVPWHAVNERRADYVFASYNPAAPTAVAVGLPLSAGDEVQLPLGGGIAFSQAGGTFTVSASGPAGAKFDLKIYSQDDFSTTLVASATQVGPNEKLVYAGKSGYYFGVVKVVSGSGATMVRYDFPK